MNLQQTALTKERYDVQLSVKPIYSLMDDLLKRLHSTTSAENSYQGNNFFKFLTCTKIIPLEVCISLHQEEILLIRNSTTGNKSKLLRICSAPNFNYALTVKLVAH